MTGDENYVYRVSVTCPRCEEDKVTAIIQATEPSRGSWINPPDPQEILDVLDLDYSCDCYELKEESRYMDPETLLEAKQAYENAVLDLIYEAEEWVE